MAWYWRPVRQEEDFEDARARLRELIGQSLGEGGPVDLEQREAIALLTELLEDYEVRRLLEDAGEVTGATLLAAQMARHDMGSYQFANLLGVAHARVSDVLRGKSLLSRTLARALLDQGVAPMRVLAAVLAPKSPAPSLGAKGFTLVELMVVVAIIALLATISTPSLMGYIERARLKDATNLVASYLQNARDQSMSRGEVVLVRVTSASGRPTIETFRAPLVESTTQAGPDGVEYTRDRYASTCSEIPDLAAAFTLTERVAVLNPVGTTNGVELAERLHPDIRLLAMTRPASSELGGVVSASTTLDLCFLPDGRVVYAASSLSPTTRVGVCIRGLVFVLGGKSETGPSPDSSQQLDPRLTNWVCPAIEGDEPDEEKIRLSRTLGAMRDVAGVGVVSMSFHGAVSAQ